MTGSGMPARSAASLKLRPTVPRAPIVRDAHRQRLAARQQTSARSRRPPAFARRRARSACASSRPAASRSSAGRARSRDGARSASGRAARCQRATSSRATPWPPSMRVEGVAGRDLERDAARHQRRRDVVIRLSAGACDRRADEQRRSRRRAAERRTHLAPQRTHRLPESHRGDPLPAASSSIECARDPARGRAAGSRKLRAADADWSTAGAVGSVRCRDEADGTRARRWRAVALLLAGGGGRGGHGARCTRRWRRRRRASSWWCRPGEIVSRRRRATARGRRDRVIRCCSRAWARWHGLDRSRAQRRVPLRPSRSRRWRC